MEEESFKSGKAATLLNRYFVSIKVDREERPDIDTVYMEVCQAMTGSGGWPLTIVMTPDKKPFYATTYLPLHSGYGRIGLVELLTNLAALWQKKRDVLLNQSKKIVRHFSARTPRRAQTLPDGAAVLSSMFEEKYGGFSGAPKFPMPHYIAFLLTDWKASGRQKSLDMATFTLARMYRGGLFDHVGGGFSRYSTDEKWLVPHFEKMLYDNALLLGVYAQAFAATQDALFGYVAKKVADYLIRDMQMQAFCAAEDADSEKEEGRFYVWDYEALQKALPPDDLLRLEGRYGLKPKGNFEGKTVLNRVNVPGMADAADDAVLKKLYALREKRVRPFRDEKVSASWNGLAIEAMATAGMVLGNDAYVQSARRAADFVLTHMVQGDMLLCGTYMDGARGPAFLADYANMVLGLLALYAAERRIEDVKRAAELAQTMLLLFSDAEGFAMAPHNAEPLFMRPRDDNDGALPAGSARAVLALTRLYHITGSQVWQREAQTALDKLRKTEAYPGARIHLLNAAMLLERPHRHVVLCAPPDSAQAAYAYRTLSQRYDPFTTVLWHDGSAHMDAAIPFVAQYKTDAPFAGYVCENFTCQRPVYSADELLAALSDTNEV